jgi:hypothetical protein
MTVWGPARAITRIKLSFLFLAVLLTLEYKRSWTAAERLYLSDYLKSGTRGQASATMQSKYTLLEGVTGKGQQRFVPGDEIEPTPDVNGKPGYRQVVAANAEICNLQSGANAETLPYTCAPLLSAGKCEFGMRPWMD